MREELPGGLLSLREVRLKIAAIAFQMERVSEQEAVLRQLIAANA